MKKLIALLCVVAMAIGITACGSTDSNKDESESKTYKIGICQLVQHPALDAATEGFKDYLTDKLGDRVEFDEQNAAGDSANCSTICNQFASENDDLIMANATGALQAAVSATKEIPILGTSITDYGSALGIDGWDGGATGANVSGTTDLAPLDEQANMVQELFPDAKKVGIIYCSSEPNSVYQAETIKGYFNDLGITTKEYTFSDSNDVASVTKSACADSDVIYIPTDNTAASCAKAINNVALKAEVPIVAGEEGICSGCGVATLSISYYDLGQKTGEMAYNILEKGEDISKMEIQSAPKFTKEYNEDICKTLGIEVPEGYEKIEAE
ncbi:MAG: ABC transporter substrate binding protein [Ruminococcus sp.]